MFTYYLMDGLTRVDYPDRNYVSYSYDNACRVEITGCSDKDSECRIYHLNNETGAGMITVYNVFTGISAALTSSAPKIFQNKIYGCIYPL